MGCTTAESGFDAQNGEDIVSSVPHRPDLGPIQLPVQWAQDSLFLSKVAERETVHSPPPKYYVKNA
jgi:hypothetical protein